MQRVLIARRPVLILTGLALVLVAMMLPFGPSGRNTRVAFATGDPECTVPVDISMVFDHSGSMDDSANKFSNAKAAAIGFVDSFAGGPSDNDLTPHQMALTGLHDGIANTDMNLGTNAATLRSTITGWSDDTM